ncbi:MAG: A/G-specific adenine glycosylase [Anaerolineae bacterium]
MTASGAPFSAVLLAWYDREAAEFPWRARPGSDPDPSRAYYVWLSEIMLQQTQVETVRPYFERFVEAFPTVEALATAPLDDVLKLWEGLGYYSRARHLHRTAQIVTEQYDGQFPSTVNGLQELPGIGRYTAGAIASIAYGERAPVLDGNVIRVFARVTDLPHDVTVSRVKSDLWNLAEEWLPPTRTGDYNQALMELGRRICTPRAPRCPICPIMGHCLANARGTQEERPVKRARAATPHHDVTAGLIWNDRGQLLIAQRPLHGLLGGLWEFPGGKVEPDESLEDCLRRELWEELAIEVEVGDLFCVVRHAFTHFSITLHTFNCRYLSGDPQPLGVQAFNWVEPGQLAAYAFGKADRQVITHLRSRRDMLL